MRTLKSVDRGRVGSPAGLTLRGPQWF